MRRVYALFLIAFVLTATPDGRAGGLGDGVLAELFQRLKATADSAEAENLQGRIWERWMQTGDKAVDVVLARGTVAMSLGDYRRAMTDFDYVIERRPGESEGWNKRATLHFLLGDFDASVSDIGRTLAIEPRHFGALSGLGMIEAERKNYPAALAAYRRALEANPHLTGVRDQIEILRNLVEGRKI